MRQRVALARALAQDSSCCSWTSRSPRSTRSPATCCTRSSPGSGRSRPLSVVFVTHNVREAVRLGQRVVLLVLAARPRRPRVARSTSRSRARIESPGCRALAAEITERAARGDQPPWPADDRRARPALRSTATSRRQPRRGGRPRRARDPIADLPPAAGAGLALRPAGAAAVVFLALLVGVWQLAYVAELKPPYALPGAGRRLGRRSWATGRRTARALEAIWTSLQPRRGRLRHVARHRHAARAGHAVGAAGCARAIGPIVTGLQSPAVGRLGARRDHLVRAHQRRDLRRRPARRRAVDRQRPAHRHSTRCRRCSPRSGRVLGAVGARRGSGTCCCRPRCPATSAASGRAGRSPGAR